MRMIKYLLLFVLTMSIISCSKKTAVEDHTNAEAQEIPKGEHIQGKPSKGKSMVSSSSSSSNQLRKSSIRPIPT